MGDVIDIRSRILAARAKDLVKGDGSLTREEVLLVLSCDPLATEREILDALDREVNSTGILKVRRLLNQLFWDGWITYRFPAGWRLKELGQLALDAMFSVEDNDGK